MSPWQILEIAPTADQKAIKKAYAAKLKLLIPDEQPEEFQRLKTAFDSALTLSKNDSLIEDINLLSTYSTSEPVESSHHLESCQSMDFEQTNLTIFQPLHSFSDQLQQVIDEENYFENLSIWKELTASIDSWSIDEYMQNTYTIQLFLVEHYPCLARTIIRFLFQAFDLTGLTDHIGQERFVSADFIYLKKMIYNVPPFSFQIAENIPKGQRQTYFRKRYDIFQTIANKQSYIIHIDEQISECASIFADNSELWNLQILDLLDKANGFPETTDEKLLLESLLNRTKTMNDNPTTEFLTHYFQLLDGRSTDDTIFNWNKEYLVIPEELFLLFLGCIFFSKAQYVPAFNLYKQLSISRKIALQNQFKVIFPHLAKRDKIEYRRIEKEIHEVLKPKTETTVSFRQGFIFLFCSVLVLLFMIKMPTISQTPRRTARTPEQLVEEFKAKYADQQESSLSSSDELSELELHGDTLEERFVHYFYTSNDPDGKRLFIEKHVHDEQLEKLLTYYVDQDTQKYNDRSKFRFKANTISDPKSKKTAIYYDEELLCILESGEYQFDLIDVYGDQWHILSDIKRQHMLKAIEVNPESSTMIFLKNFLFSNNKQENLLKYTDYLSENMKVVLETKMQEPVSEKLSRGFLYLVRQPVIKFIVSDQDQENEEKLILTFDELGRLDHVYGPHWEEVDEEMIHYSNREAFKNIPTLLEEPD